MRLFVDTGAWFALNDRKDRHHAAASRFLESFGTEPVLLFTTDYIVDEAVTLLRFKISHREAVAFLKFISQSAQVSFEQVTEGHLKRAGAIFSRYQDKLWSFTDCVSFAFMEERGLADAFTFDSNFAQFGLRVHPSDTRSGADRTQELIPKRKQTKESR